MKTNRSAYLVEPKPRQGIFWEADVYTDQGAYIGTASGWTVKGRDEKVAAIVRRQERKS